VGNGAGDLTGHADVHGLGRFEGGGIWRVLSSLRSRGGGRRGWDVDVRCGSYEIYHTYETDAYDPKPGHRL
jgi:hypothetical protein